MGTGLCAATYLGRLGGTGEKTPEQQFHKAMPNNDDFAGIYQTLMAEEYLGLREKREREMVSDRNCE